jgi:hypothetical protein
VEGIGPVGAANRISSQAAVPCRLPYQQAGCHGGDLPARQVVTKETLVATPYRLCATPWYESITKLGSVSSADFRAAILTLGSLADCAWQRALDAI